MTISPYAKRGELALRALSLPNAPFKAGNVAPTAFPVRTIISAAERKKGGLQQQHTQKTIVEYFAFPAQTFKDYT
jgi:hypothetical protein